ncbi:spatacsin-like isoform X6 [Halichondria panicea]|uniref:spatacsin-like isoform X6 n=1 Tax=Halichondria panicea TaxID=6063 RepID=UPI00312BB18A
MEHLPVILKKSRPYLTACSEGSNRAVCPRGKLLCFLDSSNNLQVHSLHGHDESTSVDGMNFAGFHWVAAIDTGQDCVMDEGSQQRSDLLAITPDLCLHWYSVCEGGGAREGSGAREEEGMKIEQLATLSKDDLLSELKKLKFSDSIDTVQAIGSYNNRVLLLVNSDLVCTVTFDPEFSRMIVLRCLSIELSTDAYADSSLPQWVGPIVNVTFVRPLMFALTQDGLVFVYNMMTSQCIGVVYAIAYSQYQCSRQADSEELLSSISTASFKYAAVSPDLVHLAAATEDNNIVLINLPDYFQMFPGHYNSQFTRSYLLSQRSRVIAPVHQSTIEQEEEGDRLKYGGYSDKNQTEPYLGLYHGFYGHTNRLQRLNNLIEDFQPSQSQTLNFYKASHFESSSTFVTKRNRMLKLPGVKNAVSQIAEIEPLMTSRKPWFKEPVLHSVESMSKSNFNVNFVTGMSKSIASRQQSPLVSNLEEALSPSKYYYGHLCLLPAPPTSDSCLVSVEFSSKLVVCYYGSDKVEAVKKEEETSPIVGGARVMVNTLVIYHTDKQTYSISRLVQPSWLVLPAKSDQLLYLANSQMLAVTTFDLSQEEFIAKVLMYGSASVAEELCHLNRWDKCSLPVNALETALELRQLDTLAFFLRSRDTGSSEGDGGTQTPTDETTPTLPPLPPEQLDTVVQLLIGAIRRNYVEEHYCQFASQLLLMTLGFLTRIIRTQVILEAEEGKTETEHATGGESVVEENSTMFGPSVSLMDLTGYIDQLRAFLPKAEKSNLSTGSAGVVGKGAGPMTYVDQALVKAWDKMSTKEVIKDALLKSSLPLAQTYLVHTRTSGNDKTDGRGFTMDSSGFGLSGAVEDQTVRDGEGHYDGSLSHMTTVAMGFVVEALDRRDLHTATSLLMQTGTPVAAGLKHICFHTVSRSLRDYLAEELLASSWLLPTEIQALDYLHTLEALYPLQSYDHAHSLYSKHHPRKMTFQPTALPAMPGIVSRPTPIPTVGNLQDVYPETFGGDYLLSRDSASSSSDVGVCAPYLQVGVAAVMEWDTPTRERVLFEGLVLTSKTDGLEARKMESKEHVFQYHVSRSDVTSSLRFIMSSIPPLENHTPCPAHIIELCSKIPHPTQYLKTCLRNELARHGVFVPDDLQDLPSLLYRLGQVHSLFTHPHPLTKLTEDEECEDGGAVISLESFHSGFLKYLVENRFYSFMYHYLDQYNLALDSGSISLLGLDQAEEPWVEVLLQYRRAAIHQNDPDVIFQASLSCGHLLLSTGNGGHMTVMGMLSNGRTLMAMATLMFAPVPLEEAMNTSNSGQPWFVDPLALRRSVSAYPSLQAALFPPPLTSLSPSHSQDISVYQLLQGNVPFNISRLFKWQSTNRSGHEEGTADSSELPHFSSPALTEKFAFTEHLNFVYYLRRGQPSFAFANFVAAKLIGHSNTSKRLDRASSRVYRLAMLDFTNSRLISSCVAFMEMCERDSTHLRVDSQAALRMARYSSDSSGKEVLKEENNDPCSCQKIASQFVQLHCNPDNTSLAGSLLSQLESSTHHMISSGGVELHGLEAEECWSLVQSFCQCHQLPPSLEFITVCAREGQWLPLLCHSQLCSIPPQKVLLIVDKHFSDLSLREHLHLAVSSMVTRATSPSLDHVGLKRDATPQADRGPPAEEEEGPDKPPAEKQESDEQPTPVSPPPTVPPAEPYIPIEESDLPEDLFSALLKCQADKTPWRSLLAHAIALERPLLAVLAACYENTSMVPCMCVWLYSTLGETVMKSATQLLGIVPQGDESLRFCADLQWREWTLHDLSLLLISAMQATPTPAASFTLAFKYFDKSGGVNPMMSWMRFHEEFLCRSDYEECARTLSEFNLARDKVHQYSMELSIGDTAWVDEVAATMAMHMLVRCPTPFERSHLLRLLSEAQFGQDFKCTASVLKYEELYQMTLILTEAGLASNTAFTFTEAGLASNTAVTLTEAFDTSSHTQTLAQVYTVEVEVHAEYVLSQLLQKEQFSIARKYANIVNSTASKVTVKKAEHNLRKLVKSSYWRYLSARLSFWSQCDTNFQNEDVDPLLAADFFERIVHNGIEELSNSTPCSREATPTEQTTPCSAMECARLLAYALKWRKLSPVAITTEQTREFEREIWRSHIKATMETLETLSTSSSSSSSLPFLPELQGGAPDYSQYTDHTSLLSSLSVTAEEEFKGRRRLNELLLSENVPVKVEGPNKSGLSEKEGHAFDLLLGRLLNAGLITQARELAQLFNHDSADLTIVLSLIKLALGHLTPDQLTQDVLSLVSARSPLARHLSDSAHLESGPSRPSVEVLRIMNVLSERARYSNQCCYVIITCFKLAVALRTPYASIVNRDPFDTLTIILSKSLPEKNNLAGQFIKVCNLEPRLVAEYLANMVATGLAGKSNGRDSPKASVYHPHTTSRDFQAMIAHLIQDHTHLGNSLLSMAKLLVSVDTPSQEFGSPVELLIRAHDAFSLGCYVDGIADVLFQAQQWVGLLMEGKQYSLMVRMLTGISRYNEMSYIIGLLIEADEFERLVHTGVEKEEQLRVALLDYLRSHGNNPEMIQMVALKFAMFRELAKTRQEQAEQEVKSLRPKMLVASNSDTVKRLKSAFDGYKAAAKTYAQEDILSKAEYCTTQARLVALQLSLLQQRKQVINLSARNVLQYMETEPFSEALIVSEAYRHCIHADWVNTIYKKVVVKGDFKYLSDFQSSYSLAPSMVQDLCNKYMRDKEKTFDMTTNIKKLLNSHLRNLPLRKRLSVQLGFKDTSSGMFDDSFLSDLSRL